MDEDKTDGEEETEVQRQTRDNETAVEMDDYKMN